MKDNYFKNHLFRIVWAMAGPIVGMFLFCRIFLSYENAMLLSSMISLFIFPSVLLFVFFGGSWFKYFGFFGPVTIVLVILLYGFFEIRLNELTEGVGDGSMGMCVMCSIVYGFEIILAFVFLHLKCPFEDRM